MPGSLIDRSPLGLSDEIPGDANPEIMTPMPTPKSLRPTDY